MIDTRRDPSDAGTDRAEDFASFYARHHAEQLARATVLSRTRDGAADAVHEAFVDVYRNWSRLRNPDAYLRRAVINRCRDDGRRSTSRSRLRLRLLREPSPRSEPASVSIDRDDELWAALAELPFNQRAAIVLRYFAGHTETEIADLLDCSTGSVGPWINRGLERIRRNLDR